MNPIDRDADGIQIYQFQIFACEQKIPSACANQNISFLVDDINDQFPNITAIIQEFNMDENYYGDLDLGMVVIDMDIVRVRIAN